MKKLTILAVTAFIALCTAQAQNKVPQKLSFDTYNIRIEKNRLGRQYVYKTGNEKEEIRLPKGTYLLEGTYGIEGSRYNESFQFIIDDGGQLCDSALWMVKKTLVTFYYENGIAVKGKSVPVETGILYSEVELKDSVQTTVAYYPSGKMRKKEIVYFNRNYAEILAFYYENGNMKSQTNGLDQTFKTWHENGNPHRVDDKKNNASTWYNEDGTIDRHATLSEVTNYTYKNGKLEYYTVENKKTGTYKEYDSAGRLLNDNTNNSTPEATISIQF